MTPPGDDAINVHGTAVLLDGGGVLITGSSGSGKSLLALDLIENGLPDGRRATLIADDRVEIRAHGSGLVLSAPRAIKGMIELRGFGILRRDAVQEARLALVINLVDVLERMPEDEAFAMEFLGHIIQRCPVPRRGVIDPLHQRLLVAEAVRTGRRADAENIA